MAAAAAVGGDLKAQLIEYQSMVEETLKPLLERKKAELARVRGEAEELRDLRGQLQAVLAHAGSGPFKMLTDLGAGYRMHARIEAPAAARVSVLVGAGVYVDMGVQEAAEWAAARVDALQR